jgi:hypothetical protein
MMMMMMMQDGLQVSKSNDPDMILGGEPTSFLEDFD